MIRPLRRRHLRMIVVLTALVAVLFVLAILSRPPLPAAIELDEVPASLPTTPDSVEGGHGA